MHASQLLGYFSNLPLLWVHQLINLPTNQALFASMNNCYQVNMSMGLQRVGGRSLDVSSEACACLLSQQPVVPLVKSAPAAMYTIPDEVPQQASIQQHSPPAICSLPPGQLLGQPEPEIDWLGVQDPMSSHGSMVMHDTVVDNNLTEPFPATADCHTIHHPWPQQNPPGSPPQFTRPTFVPSTATGFASLNDNSMSSSRANDCSLRNSLLGGDPVLPYCPTMQPTAPSVRSPTAPSGLSPAALQRGSSFSFSQQYHMQQVPDPPTYMAAVGSQASMNQLYPCDIPPAVTPFAHEPAAEISQRSFTTMPEPQGGGHLVSEPMRQRFGHRGQIHQQVPHGYEQGPQEIWQMPQGRAQQPQGYQELSLSGQQPLQRGEEVSQGFRQGSEQVLQSHEPQSCWAMPQGVELIPRGLLNCFEDRVVPGRPMYAEMHSQSCSRVHPRGFDRTTSFTGERSTIHFSNIRSHLLHICHSTLLSCATMSAIIVPSTLLADDFAQAVPSVTYQLAIICAYTISDRPQPENQLHLMTLVLV